jgi:hypothetical protein
MDNQTRDPHETPSDKVGDDSSTGPRKVLGKQPEPSSSGKRKVLGGEGGGLPTDSPTPASGPSSRKRTLIVLGLIVAVGLLVAVGVAAYYAIFLVDSNPPEATPNQPISPEEVTTSTLTETAVQMPDTPVQPDTVIPSPQTATPIPTDAPNPTLSPTSILTSTDAPTALSPTSEAILPPTTQAISAVVTTDDVGLNVRSGPGSPDYEILGSLEPGTELTLLARSPDGEWFQIAYPAVTGGRGWVIGEFLELQGSPPDLLPIATVPPTPTPTLSAPTPTLSPSPSPPAATSCIELPPKGDPEAGTLEPDRAETYCFVADGQEVTLWNTKIQDLTKSRPRSE